MKSIMKNKELIMNILLKQNFITNQGINYKGEKDVALNEILNLIDLAVQQERDRCVEAVKETMRYSSIEMKLSALVGIFGKDVIQAINKDHE